MKAEQLVSHHSPVLIVEDDPDLSLALGEQETGTFRTSRRVAGRLVPRLTASCTSQRDRPRRNPVPS